jgi:type IV secretory pathway TraG/TraD family ATPase VirD4
MRADWLIFKGDKNHVALEDRSYGRALIMPEEITRMDYNEQILLLPHSNPISAYKVPYFVNRRYYDDHGNPAFRMHPNFAGEAMPDIRSWDFETRNRRNTGAGSRKAPQVELTGLGRWLKN